MKYSTQTDENCEQALHKTTFGDAFALDPKSKFVVFGGEYSSTIVDLNDPNNVVKQIRLDTPKKWIVKNYEWDPSGVIGNERFLQSRNKIIEIINTETSKTLITLNSHSQPINDAKWSSKSLIASSSNDNNIIIWNWKESNKPKLAISSVGEIDRLAWSKNKENILACSCNNDIRIYDIRKPNSAIKYITNAHSKKIYSLDWCSGQEEILLSSSRDRNIRLWNFNMLNQKFMDWTIPEFYCWKAKFTPYGLCFAVIPTCQSIYNPYSTKAQNMSPRSLNHHLNDSIINSSETHQNENDKLIMSTSGNQNSSFKQQHQSNLNKVESTVSLLVCQITSLDEGRIFKFLTNKFDTILDFDFYTQNDRFNIVSWTTDQYLCIQTIDSNQLVTKDLERSSSAHNNNTKLLKEEEASSNVTTKQAITTNNPMQPNTSNSSRKSSFSEFGCYGTPPTNLTSRSILDRESFNLTDENNELFRNSNSISITHSTILRSTSSVDFLRKYPKTFGAKFCGLPEHFIVFSNEGQFKIGQREHHELASKKFRNKMKGASSSSNTKSQHSKQLAKRVQAKVYIHDISTLININKDFAQHYLITDFNLKKVCDQNFITSIQLKRYDIAKIWELLKFITFNNVDTFSLNPDDGRPWSCTTFGRPLINNIIDNCVKSNDIQTASMIISKLKQHDMNMIPIASKLKQNEKKKLDNTQTSNVFYTKENVSYDFANTELKMHLKNLGLLDPSRSSEFDFIIKFYCKILHGWSLYNKRIEMYEYVDEKPNGLDEKFECSKRCVKCSNTTNNAKCNKCNTYLTYCSICELPVNGLTTYCVICGHGGHYDHYIEWFKRHEDCPSACGCRCIDYL